MAMTRSKQQRHLPSRAWAGGQAALVMAVMLGMAVLPLVLGTVHAGSAGAAAAIAEVACSGALLLLVVWLLSRADPSRVETLGLARTASWPRVLCLGLGAAFATYAVSALAAAAYVLASGASLTGQAAAGGGSVAAKTEAMSLLASIPLWAMIPMALFAGFYEEIVFRGFVLRRLIIALGPTSRIAAAAAVVVSALIFGAGHAYQGWLGVTQTFVAGLCFGALTVLTGGVRAAIVAHAAIDLLSLVALHVLRPLLERLPAAGS